MVLFTDVTPIAQGVKPFSARLDLHAADWLGEPLIGKLSEEIMVAVLSRYRRPS